MNILYIIGNGFDINLGLKTSYQDFYNYYIGLPSSNNVIAKLKEHLTAYRYTTWADMELGLGHYTREVGSWREMETVCHDLSYNMRVFLLPLQKGFVPSPEERKRMTDFLLAPQSGLYIGGVRAVSSFMTVDKEINVINFNYTKTFERLCGYASSYLSLSPKAVLRLVYHIHQSLDNTDVIIGVNDDNQIDNKEIICPELEDLMVKPHINNQLGTLVDNECVGMINQANLFCLFGVSLGESDNIWWNLIEYVS